MVDGEDSGTSGAEGDLSAPAAPPPDVIGDGDSAKKAASWRLPAALAAGVLVLGLVAGAYWRFSQPTGATASSAARVAASPATPVQAPALYAVGEPIQQNGYDFAVASLSTPPSVGSGGPESASPGAVLLAVDYTIRNISQQPIRAADLPRVLLVNPAGARFEAQPAETEAYRTQVHADQASDLAPGGQARGAAVFVLSRQQFDPTRWMIALGDRQNGPRISLASLKVAPAVAATPALALVPSAAPPVAPESGAAPAPIRAALQARSGRSARLRTDEYVCAHGDPQDDATIRACDRKDFALENGEQP